MSDKKKYIYDINGDKIGLLDDFPTENYNFLNLLDKKTNNTRFDDTADSSIIKPVDGTVGLEVTNNEIKFSKSANLNNNQIKNLALPTDENDAVTKIYSDTKVGGLNGAVNLDSNWFTTYNDTYLRAHDFYNLELKTIQKNGLGAINELNVNLNLLKDQVGAITGSDQNVLDTKVNSLNGAIDFRIDSFSHDLNGIYSTNAFNDSLNTDSKNTVGAINELKGILDNLTPIGTILINEVASNFNPGIGTWELVSQLQEGQTIVGGSNTNGEVITHNHSQNSHNHISLRGLKSGYDYDKNSRGGGNPDLHSVYAYNSDGSNKDYYFPNREGESGNSGTLYTNKVTAPNNPTGGNYNKPYGLGLGTKYVWKRIG